MILKFWLLFYRTFQVWSQANASRMSAALTYFTMLSLAPILMMVIAIAGYVYDDQLAESEVVEQVTRVTTPEIAQTVAGLIRNAAHPQSGLVAGTISLCVLTFAASGVFTQLYDTFNDIWGVSHEDTNGFLLELQKRLIGIGMVLLIGLLLISTLLINSMLGYVSDWIDASFWLDLIDRGLSYLLLPFLITLMFWFFPATRIKWQDVWPAGVLTALMIGASRYFIDMYLRFSSTSEVYGAAGSLVILLIWVYITGLVVFFGASFSFVWSQLFGSRRNEFDARGQRILTLGSKFGEPSQSTSRNDEPNATEPNATKRGSTDVASSQETPQPTLEPIHRTQPSDPPRPPQAQSSSSNLNTDDQRSKAPDAAPKRPGNSEDESPPDPLVPTRRK